MMIIPLHRRFGAMPFFLAALLHTGMCQAGPSDDLASADAEVPAQSEWVMLGQTTLTGQYHPQFASPYAGPNSLTPAAASAETFDLTLMFGHRLWQGAEFWVNPEVDQGFGLSNTLGVAGFTSGEAYKLGANQPYLRVQRAFVRQTVNLGGEVQAIEAGPNQLATSTTQNNLVLTVGRFSVVDLFDTNSYAHDPKADFLNWSVIDGGAFDYAADPWGFTYGAALEWNADDWTLRGGVFEMSPVPNAKLHDITFHQSTSVIELEQRHILAGHTGKIKLLAYVNRADMGSYADALALAAQTGGVPDTARVRRAASNPGVVLNVEQEVLNDVGVFARASATRGDMEAYEFTDLTRSLSAGLSLSGELWKRTGDRAGLALVSNALSADAQRYFSAGGLGILIGDGHLDYAREQIGELFYSLRLAEAVTLSADIQRVINPAYNQARGPVSVAGLRLHGEF